MSQADPSKSNLAMVRQFYEATDRGSETALTQLLHPDFIAHEAASLPYAGRFAGMAGLLKLLEQLGDAWSEMDATEFDYVASGESVVASFRLRATSRSTGRTIDQRICEYWKFRDGQAVHLQPFYFDAHLVWEACRSRVTPGKQIAQSIHRT